MSATDTTLSEPQAAAELPAVGTSSSGDAIPRPTNSFGSMGQGVQVARNDGSVEFHYHLEASTLPFLPFSPSPYHSPAHTPPYHSPALGHPYQSPGQGPSHHGSSQTLSYQNPAHTPPYQGQGPSSSYYGGQSPSYQNLSYQNPSCQNSPFENPYYHYPSYQRANQSPPCYGPGPIPSNYNPGFTPTYHDPGLTPLYHNPGLPPTYHHSGTLGGQVPSYHPRSKSADGVANDGIIRGSQPACPPIQSASKPALSPEIDLDESAWSDESDWSDEDWPFTKKGKKSKKSKPDTRPTDPIHSRSAPETPFMPGFAFTVPDLDLTEVMGIGTDKADAVRAKAMKQWHKKLRDEIRDEVMAAVRG